MSTEKHTQGPWRVRPDAGPWRAVCEENGTSAYEAVLADDEVVALVVARSPDPWGDAPPTEHNARLVAAAPELLAALRDLVDMMTGRMDGETVALHNALAALRSATGAA
jgi:hypothetical protein